MTLHNEYLTDEELEQLISEVEACDLVTAPPDLAKQVMGKIREKRKKQNRDFAGYCFRVGLSVAAAVAFIFMMPYLPEFEISGDKIQGIAENKKDELLETAEWKEQWDVETERPEPDYPTKEEVLNDTGLLHRVFNGNNNLTKTELLDSLTGKDGGQ